MCRRAVADLAGAKVAVRRPPAITHTTLESMRVPVTPVSEAVQRSQGSADPHCKRASGAPQKESIVRRLGWLLRGRTVEAEEEGAASDDWDPRWQLRRASRRKRWVGAEAGGQRAPLGAARRQPAAAAAPPAIPCRYAPIRTTSTAGLLAGWVACCLRCSIAALQSSACARLSAPTTPRHTTLPLGLIPACRCTTTNWAGRVVSETVHEVTEVRNA